MALADWLGKGQSPVAQVAGRGLNGKFEWEFLSAVFLERGPCRRHSHSKWRIQNKMESASLGPLFQSQGKQEAPELEGQTDRKTQRIPTHSSRSLHGNKPQSRKT